MTRISVRDLAAVARLPAFHGFTLSKNRVSGPQTRIPATKSSNPGLSPRFTQPDGSEFENLTEGVRAAGTLLPTRILLPHPSPRNQMWLVKNNWFERETLPLLRERVQGLLEADQD